MCENRWDMNLSEIPTGSRKDYKKCFVLGKYTIKKK